MAENVVIRDIGPGLEEWASEESMKDLIKLFKKSIVVNEKQLKKLEEMIKSGDENAEELEDILGDLTPRPGGNNANNNNNNNNNSGGGNQGGSRANSTSRTESFVISSLATGLQNSLPKSGLFAEFGKSLVNTTKDMDKFSASLVLTTAYAATKIIGTAKDVTKAYTEVYKAGIVGANAAATSAERLAEFASSANAANLTFEELQKVTTDYGKVMNRVGIKAFADASRSFGEGAKVFGLRSEESAEYLANWTERQRISGALSDITDAKTQKRAMQNLKITTGFAQALGKSTDELNKQATDAALDIDLNAALSSLADDPALRDSMQMMLSNMDGPLKDLTIQMMQMGEGLAHGSALYTEMATVGGKEVADLMADFNDRLKSGAIAPEDLQKELGITHGKIAQAIKDNMGTLEVAASAQMQMGNTIRGILPGIESFGKAIVGGTPVEDDTANAVASIEDSLKAGSQAVIRGIAGTMAEGADSYVAALTEAGNLAKTHVEGQRQFINKAAEATAGAFDAVTGAAKDLLGAFNKLIKFVDGEMVMDTDGALASLSENFDAGMVAAGTGIAVALAGLKTMFVRNFLNADGGMLKKGLEAIGKTIKGFAIRIPLVGTIISGIIGMFDGMLKVFDSGETNFFKNFGTIVTSIFGAILDGIFALGQLVGHVVDFLTGDKMDISGKIQYMRDAFSYMFDNLGATFDFITSKLMFWRKDDKKKKKDDNDGYDMYAEANKIRAAKGQAPIQPPNRTSVKPPEPKVKEENVADASQAASNPSATPGQAINNEESAIVRELRNLNAANTALLSQNSELIAAAKKTATNTGQNQTGLL